MLFIVGNYHFTILNTGFVSASWRLWCK